MLYSVRQLRHIEQTAANAIGHGTLMQRAGLAVANLAKTILSDQVLPVLVIAGPGNNGGDAFEAAAHLSKAGFSITLIQIPARNKPSPERMAATEKAKVADRIQWLSDLTIPDQRFGLVIDGLFGIGLSKQSFAESVRRLIEQTNQLSCPVLAIDIPSGLDSDTGNLLAEIAIEADFTISLIGDKPGLHTGSGRDYAGQVTIDSLEIPDTLFDNSMMELNQTSLFASILAPRRHNTNKGSYGSLQLIGGASGMQGALLLASRAALYSGAGRVFAGFVESPPAFDPLQPEIMCRSAKSLPIKDATACVIGPGLGNSTTSFDVLSRVLLDAKFLIIDADALNLMAQQPALHALCTGRDNNSTLLTPHPLEAARLLSSNVESVQSDRIAAAKSIARRYNAVVILKGSGSIIAHPSGDVIINPTGNPGLASGGSGDVLAGICGAFTAQRSDTWQSALAATYLHGAAADELVQRGHGPIGLCASELIVETRHLLNTHIPKS